MERSGMRERQPRISLRRRSVYDGKIMQRSASAAAEIHARIKFALSGVVPVSSLSLDIKRD